MPLACFYLYDYLFRVKHESMFISRLFLFPQKPLLLREPCDAVIAVASLRDISCSDGHAIFKVQVRSQEHFSEKIALSRISKRWKNALKTQISTLMDKSGKRQNLMGGHRYTPKTHYSVTAQRFVRRARCDAGTAFAETGISDYDKLSKEQFVSLIETLKLSKYLKAPSTGEGKQNRKCRTASEKETQIRKPRHLLNAGVGVLFPCNALEFLAQSRSCALKNQAVSRLCGVS